MIFTHSLTTHFLITNLMLLPRFLTALIGIPLLVGAIWWGQLAFFFMLFGIAMLALYEFLTLAQNANWPVSKKSGLFLGSLLILLFFLLGSKMGVEAFSRSQFPISPLSPSLVLVLLIALIILSLFSRKKENVFLRVAVTWLGICYTVWSLSHLLLVRDIRPDGLLYTFLLFIVIWALDIGAYGGGLKFGRRKLSESISPKKTWEGVVAGTLAALIAGLICQQTFLKSLTVLEILLLSAFVAVFAQFSDLSESLFKRNVQVKDSSSLLPGHGGILDRFDSFLLTSPIYYYLLTFWIVK